VDEIITHEGWKRLQAASAEEGLVALGYERRSGAFSRLHQFAKLHLFAPSSAIFTCPLAMTDGAARMLEKMLRDGSAAPGRPSDEAAFRECFARLVTRVPERFWTSGQWMTERPGGSDISRSETVAVRQPDGTYRLRGYKFFTSATTAEMTVTLARVSDAVPLSAFVGQVQRDADGRLDGVRVAKLKQKLGTRALPTAELELDGLPARLIGPEGRGVAAISLLFNLTRLHNAIASCAALRRALAIARDYAHRRLAFGRRLAEQPLHLDLLARLETTYRACLFFTLDSVLLLGRLEIAEIRLHELQQQQQQAEQLQRVREEHEEADLLLRVLTPLVKLYTARMCLQGASEALEALGGTGYMEDATILPRLLRDQQVTTIWEGTTNVLVLDLLRVLARSPTSLTRLRARLAARLSAAHALQAAVPRLEFPLACLRRALDAAQELTERIVAAMRSGRAEERDAGELLARRLAFLLSAAYAASCLIEHAAATRRERDLHAAARWCQDRLLPLLPAPAPQPPELPPAELLALNRALALDLCPKSSQPRGCGDQCPQTGRPRSRM
jgi:alkylation response protein AidB-like acyl-CoA dehydrogenase